MGRFALVIAMISSIGCVSSRPLFVASNKSVTIRAESDELSDLKKAAHDRSEAPSAPKHRESKKEKKDDCSSTDSSPGNELLGWIFFQALASPFTLPAAVLGDGYDHVTEFPDYPYAEGASGSLLRNNFEEIKKQDWMGTVQTFVIPQAHDVDRFGTRLLLDSTTRFGIDTEGNYWTQNLGDGHHDQLWTGDANVVFRFAESERMQWRAGIGLNWLSDDVRNEAGFNFTYGFDWFPARPWTVSAVIDIGSLGQSTLFHGRTTVGAMVGQAEVFAGYDYFQIDNAEFQGPVAGLGWRF